MEGQKDSNKYIITGDIGGTNFRLRVSKVNYGIENESNVIKSFTKVKENFFDTKKYQSFATFTDQIIELANIRKEQVIKIVLAIRGFQQGKCFTEFQTESEERLKLHYEGIPDVQFLNDVEGMAQSVIYCDSESIHYNSGSFIQLRHQNHESAYVKYNTPQVRLLFTMGTGTGVSLILPYQVQQTISSEIENQPVSYDYMVNSSEAWSSYLSADPQNELQAKVSEYLFRKMKTRTSLVKFCKGPSLLNLYQFMKEQYPSLNNDIILKQTKKMLKKEVKHKIVNQQECITYLAVNEKDELCQKTIDFLIEIVGCFLQRLALTTLPMGGIYISGGVANFISTYFEKRQDIFWSHFLNNEVLMEAVLEKIPVYILRENPTLDGLEAMIIHKQKV